MKTTEHTPRHLTIESLDVGAGKGSALGTVRQCPSGKTCVFKDCPHRNRHTHNHTCIRDRAADCPSCQIVGTDAPEKQPYDTTNKEKIR